VHAHWAQLIEHLQASPQDFYAAIEKALGEREIPEARITRKLWPEGGIFSARREYLRVKRRRHRIDICGAPFGTGFFSSSWLISGWPNIIVGIILVLIGIAAYNWTFRPGVAHFLLFNLMNDQLPIVNRFEVLTWFRMAILVGTALAALLGIIKPIFFPPRFTYYRYDTAQMFYLAVHKAVGDVIDGLCTAQGVRLLTEDERKPIMRGLN
jgi:hypothetical protein